MEQLLNAMRAQAGRQAGMIADSRMARVTSYDPTTYSCTVKILPEGDFQDEGDTSDTGWIPVQTMWSGPGWGVYCPPSIGDQVFVSHAEGDAGAGQIIGRVFDADHLPLAVQSGEFWLVHASGSFFKFTNDGNVAINAHAGMTVTVTGDLSANVSGNCAVTAGGTLTTTSSGATTINAAGIGLKGSGGAMKGIVQGDCVCAFTGAPHPQISATVSGTL